MSVNRDLPHVLVLPEDDANRQVANGFQLQVVRMRQMQVLNVARGWGRVLQLFESVHAREMDRCANRFMVLLVDFDGTQGRLDRARAVIPEHLADRVFVLGAWTEPEDLRRDLGGYEGIGSAMAADCRDGTETTWGHALLRHNADELDRLRQHVRSILF